MAKLASGAMRSYEYCDKNYEKNDFLSTETPFWWTNLRKESFCPPKGPFLWMRRLSAAKAGIRQIIVYLPLDKLRSD
ncbi:MAG: hypothetical protein ACI3ZT_10020, partial [Candidatus Cryptobacteroides sp.]